MSRAMSMTAKKNRLQNIMACISSFNIVSIKTDRATLQRVMDVILFMLKWQLALVYREDIIVFLKTDEQLLNHLRRVLTLKFEK